MQKKVIALAVAGLATGATFAQSNVTIYGVADAAYIYSSGELANNKGSIKYSGIDSGKLSGSRIGFKGEEALGNGLKAVFVLEYGLNIDESTALNSTRQSFVGLKSDTLGQVALGRQYAPGYSASVRADAFSASTAGSSLSYLQTAAGNTIIGAGSARINNSVTYASPRIGGFVANAIYGFGETTINTVADSLFGAGLNYTNGPLNVDAVFHARRASTKTIAGRAATSDNVNEWFLGASYDFKIVKVFASYQDQKDSNGTSTNHASNRIWNIGATVPVLSNGKVHAAYTDLSWDRPDAGDSGAWSLGYTHALSKRTTLYTSYSQVDNDNGAPVAAGFSATRAVGEKNNIFAAGIRHSF